MKEIEQNQFDEQDDWVSKTELKRQADALQALGTRLTNMGNHQLDELPLDETLRDAIELAQRIRNKREGYRRQLQYIGKFLSTKSKEMTASVSKRRSETPPKMAKA